jgi:6-pyruvoyl-tetrahydropterin synthase
MAETRVLTSYRRSFEFPAAHFNGEECYKFLRAYDEGHPLTQIEWFNLLKNCHGHNFKIDIEVTGFFNRHGFVIADEDLEALIKPWENTNLSLHDDFRKHGWRATTEYMAKVLAEKIDEIVTVTRIQIRVWETELIYAEHIIQHD